MATEPTVIDLNDLIRNAETTLARLAGNHVRLVIRLAPGLPPVAGEARQLEEVIVALIAHARDAMPGRGVLTVETAPVELGPAYVDQHRDVAPGSYVMLGVTDTGAGMTDAVRRHLFESEEASGRPPGSVIGLATVREFVLRDAGSIDVYSEPGRGTSFRLYLPVAGASATRPTARAFAGLTPGGRETILLVEDEPLVRSLAEQALTRLGYRVLACESGETALTLAESTTSPIDLLLTDVVMPGIDGTTLATRFQAIRPETRVLFVSGYTGDKTVRHAVLEEGRDFIGKPYSHHELARKIREVLDSGPPTRSS